MIIVATDYRDESGFSQANHSMAEIAEAIRHKKYGRDVREAMAQGFEAYDRVTGELVKRMNYVEKKVDDLRNDFNQFEQKDDERYNKLKKKVDSLDEQLNSGMPLDRWLEEAKEDN